MKRFLYFSLALIMAFSAICFSSAGLAQSEQDPFSDITTPYLYLMEADTESCLYSRGGDKKCFPASTTKLMTALVAVENLEDLNRVVTLGWRPVAGFGPTSSLIGLAIGEQISLIDLLYGMLMRSGNDAAKAIAIETAYEHYGENIEAAKAVPLFVELMNKKAKQLGMNSTHFATVDGRHDDEHYTTAHDFAILMKAALQDPIVSEIIATPTHQVAPTNMHPNGFYFENSNKLICKKSSDSESFIYENCIGGKTGETNLAGHCLVSAAKKDDITLILVQFGDPENETPSYYRYQVAPKLYDWGFRNYRAFSLSEFKLQTEFELQASNYSPFDKENGKFNAKAIIDGLSVTGAAANLKPYIDKPELIKTVVNADGVNARIQKNDVVGYVDYYFYDDTFVRAELRADRDVAAASSVTSEPNETAFISATPPPDNEKYSNVLLQRTPAEAQYSVWIYYNNSLYTMNSSEWHYLAASGNVFKTSASAGSNCSVGLYRRYFDSNHAAYYLKEDHVADGQEYAIVIDGMALSNTSKGGSLAAVPVDLDENGVIIGGLDDNSIWLFESSSNGYLISNGSKYLARKAGGGIVFWLLILTLIIAAFIILRLISTYGNKRQRRRKNTLRYRSTWD